MVHKIKGKFTFKTTGALFMLSAVFELLSVTSEIPLFGGVRGGVAAVSYHLIYLALFAAIGFGLWQAKGWGPKAVLAGTLFYTLDKARYILDVKTQEAYLLMQLEGRQDILELIDMGSLRQLLVLAAATFIICWWGFAIYTFIRREYFSSPDKAIPEEKNTPDYS